MKMLLLALALTTSFNSFAQESEDGPGNNGVPAGKNEIIFKDGQSQQFPVSLKKRTVVCVTKEKVYKERIVKGLLDVSEVYLMPGEYQVINPMAGIMKVSCSKYNDKVREAAYSYEAQSYDTWKGHPTCEVKVLTQNLSGVGNGSIDPRAQGMRNAIRNRLQQLGYVVYEDFNAELASAEAMTLRLRISRSIKNNYGTRQYDTNLDEAVIINPNGSEYTRAINAYNYTMDPNLWDSRAIDLLANMNLNACRLSRY